MRAYDAGAGTARVELAGRRSTAVSGVTVASNIDPALMVVGAHCVVVFNDVFSVVGAVVVAVY